MKTFNRHKIIRNPLNRHKITVSQLKKAYQKINLIEPTTTPLMANSVNLSVFLDHGVLKIEYNRREFKVKWNFMAFGGNRHLDTKGESDVELYDDGSWLAYWNSNVEIPWHLSHELYYRFRTMGMREDPEYISCIG